MKPCSPPARPRWPALLTALAAFVAAVPGAAGQVTLQLLPNRVTEQPEEGPPTTSLRFPDPPGQVLYTPPPGWRIAAEEGALILTPDDVPEARWRIESIDARTLPPLPPGRPHDRATVERYRALALLALPDRSSGPEAIAANPSLIEIDRAHALEIRVRFELEGRTFIRSRIHLPHRGQQVLFELTAPERSFEALHRTARASLFTWQPVGGPPDAPPAAPGNQPPP